MRLVGDVPKRVETDALIADTPTRAPCCVASHPWTADTFQRSSDGVGFVPSCVVRIHWSIGM